MSKSKKFRAAMQNAVNEIDALESLLVKNDRKILRLEQENRRLKAKLKPKPRH